MFFTPGLIKGPVRIRVTGCRAELSKPEGDLYPGVVLGRRFRLWSSSSKCSRSDPIYFTKKSETIKGRNEVENQETRTKDCRMKSRVRSMIPIQIKAIIKNSIRSRSHSIVDSIHGIQIQKKGLLKSRACYPRCGRTKQSN